MALSSRQSISVALGLVLVGIILFKVEPYLHIYYVDAGDRAPGFELTSDQGFGVSLDDYRGKLVLLNFWASWCAPCVQETPSLDRLHQELSDKGLVVLGVSIDENKEAYDNFIERFQISFPTVRDPTRTAATRYGTSLYPESYLIDREGIVRRRYNGAENWMRPEIVNYLRSLL